MKLRLKENPREWLKFAAAAAVFVAVVGLILRRRGVLHVPVWAAFVPGLLALCAGLIWPRALRTPYRAVMTLSFQIGQIVGGVLLTAFFLVFIAPMGFVLRLSGKDLLGLKKQKSESYWRAVEKKSSLDEMF